MPQKNIILISLKESLTKIWQNKFLFVSLFISQILFFIIFTVITYHYQTKIIESSKSIFDYLNKQNLDEASASSNILQQKNIWGDEPLMISRNFKEMVKNFRLYLMYLFISIVAFGTINWMITLRLIFKKKVSSLKKIFFKLFFILSFYLGLSFIFFYSIFNISLTETAIESASLFTKYIPFLIFSIILVYFMFVSLSLLHNTGLNNIVQKTLSIGIKKWHYILAACLINLSLFIISIISLLYFIEKNLFFLSTSILVLISSFVFGRIFIFNVIQKISFEK